MISRKERSSLFCRGALPEALSLVGGRRLPLLASRLCALLVIVCWVCVHADLAVGEHDAASMQVLAILLGAPICQFGKTSIFW